MRIDIPGSGPICFEGKLLPEAIKHLAAAPFYKALSPGAQRWVLNLRYCWGRLRQAPARTVIEACDEIEDHVYADRPGLFGHLREVFPNMAPESICADWLQALCLMREVAEKTDVCAWTMEPREGEIDYYLEQILQFMQAMEKQQQVKQPLCTPEFQRRARKASKAQKLRFIAQMTDTFSEGE
jgi:hypothetical protein